MILPIVAFGSPVLRDRCVNITNNYPELDSLIDDMWETMYAANGVGLAAPQINKKIRLFIIDTISFHQDKDTEDVIPVKQVFINPRIIDESGDKWTFNEGCLSIPEIREDIVRNSIIKIEFLDEKFNKKIKEYDGVVARVIQHEYDHINGILFIDKISPLRKRMIKGKLLDINKGKVKTSYKMRLYK